MEFDTTIRFYLMGEDKEPIIHLKSWFGDCSFRIDKPLWVNNVEGEKNLDKENLLFLFYHLIELLEEEEFPNEVQYDFARKIWNLNHPDKKVPKISMPDYLNMKE